MVKILQPSHDILIITIGIHWKKGNNPSFIAKPNILNVVLIFSEFAKNEIKNIAEPLAFIRKYFIIDSVVDELVEKRGRNPNKDNSNPIHVKNQLSLLRIIIIDKQITFM